MSTSDTRQNTAPRCVRPQVSLNGQVLPIKSFQEYCELYLGDKLKGGPREYLRVNERWEVCVAPTDGQFQQVCVPAHLTRDCPSKVFRVTLRFGVDTEARTCRMARPSRQILFEGLLQTL